MLQKLYGRFGKRTVWAVAFILGLALVLIVSWLFTGGEGSEEEAKEAVRTVEVLNVSDYQSGALGIAAPTADGRSFVVRAESGGRVDRVGRSGRVAQGTVIAEIDNAAQRAALLQAEGVYEAALAAARRSDIGVDDAGAALTSAKQGAVSADQAAFTAWNSVLFNTVDELFSNPRLGNPGVRIDAVGAATELGAQRVALGQALEVWQRDSARLSADQNSSALISALGQSISRVDQLIRLVDGFIALLPLHKPDAVFSTAELGRLQSSFAGARATLNAQRASLEAAQVSLTRAEENLRGAEIGGTGGAVSAADAQVKQALGAYRAAQNAYNKTVVRAPFAGEISSLNVIVGDFINPGSDVAIIVPDNGAETESYFDLPLSAVKYTPEGAFVFTLGEDGKVNSVAVETGLVTAGSLRVSGLTGTETIVKDVRGLKAGDTVTVR